MHIDYEYRLSAEDAASPERRAEIGPLAYVDMYSTWHKTYGFDHRPSFAHELPVTTIYAIGKNPSKLDTLKTLESMMVAAMERGHWYKYREMFVNSRWDNFAIRGVARLVFSLRDRHGEDIGAKFRGELYLVRLEPPIPVGKDLPYGTFLAIPSEVDGTRAWALTESDSATISQLLADLLE
jgi:hypothetical protein